MDCLTPKQKTELVLLFYPSLFMIMAAFVFWSDKAMDAETLRTGTAILLGAIFLSYLIRWGCGFRGDPFLFPLVAMISVLGIVFQLRLYPHTGLMQFFWVILGIGFSTALALGPDYRLIQRYRKWFIPVIISLLLITALWGHQVGGSRRWLDVGPVTVQPVELVKLLFIFYLAVYIIEHGNFFVSPRILVKREGRYTITEETASLGAALGGSLVLLTWQRDLGSILILCGVLIMMVYLYSGRLYPVLWGSGAVLAGMVAAFYIFSHYRLRVLSWIDPWSDIEGRGFQIAQSLFAFASGGLFGKGLGLGQPKLVPEIHTDFIAAAVGEEMGLAGSMALVLLYMLLIYRGFKVAGHARDQLGELLAGGMTALLAWQSFLIIAGTTKLLPLTGVTLPYLSYGGSSMIVNYLILGLLLNISSRGRGE